MTLRIYDTAGHLVRTLVDETQTPRAGGFELSWDGKDDAGREVSSGVYFCRLTARSPVQTIKMVLLR
ncbi:MAG: FlgD immunoglobulin-like domain containing protein [bacterium]